MSSLPELRFVSWKEFHDMGYTLAKQLKELRPESCTIVSVARGGHALARVLSDFLKLPIFSVSIQSYSDLQQHELHITQELNVDLRNKHVLLVDEIIDSGKTLVRALEYLEDFQLKSVTSVSLHVKPEAILKSDFYVDELTEWVVYPYEVRETIEALHPIWKAEGSGDEALKQVLIEGGIPAEWVDAFMR
jgi:hypoxanthine phosphoribosyltransferase